MAVLFDVLFHVYLVRFADWEGMMFAQIFYRLLNSLKLGGLSRDEAYLARSVDLGQLDCRMRALDHGLEI